MAEDIIWTLYSFKYMCLSGERKNSFKKNKESLELKDTLIHNKKNY